METAPAGFNVFARRTREDLREYNYVASGCSSGTSNVSCTATTRHMAAQALPHYVSRRDYPSSGLRRLYCAYAARLGASTCRAARRRLLRLRRTSGCLGSSRGSSSTTSPSPRVRVPRHVARLVVDYSASPRLVVDYSTVRPGASARRAARHVASHATRCRLLRVAQSRRRLIRAPQLRLAATLALLQPRRGARLLALRQHWL
jgi:hypothetical protein